ncbi:MAG: transketolase, partial [Thermoplasmata archaeon]|nr:transketolase [Thermoplasmata archaeon]
LEGPTKWSFTEDVGRRFEAYGWRVSHVEDGNDLDAIEAALRTARQHPEVPQLLRVRTHIGYGSPKQDTKEAHGEALGPAATIATKEKIGWPVSPPFLIPPEADAYRARCRERGTAAEGSWRELWLRYASEYPEPAQELARMLDSRLPEGWDASLPTFPGGSLELATRDASAKVMQAIAASLPGFLGGSADLAPSTKTHLEGTGDFSYEGECGRNLHFGVRENAMVGILNGLALHGGILPFGATFLIFSDYARPAIRLAALMGTHVVIVFTHDSVALGEDGPSHQPVEQLPSLRAIPHLTVLRPADGNETTEAWRIAVARAGPVALLLTRQKLPVFDPATVRLKEGVRRGAYVVNRSQPGTPKVILAASGSEVSLCLAAQQLLSGRGQSSWVVSMPSWELFAEQPERYRDEVFPSGVPVVGVEAARPLGWERFVGRTGRMIGLDRFGASAPGKVVLEKLGFTAEKVVAAALEVIGSSGGG